MKIHNPILPGFNPDPSIVRVGDDYYIATSTFEWFPGVQIHHSRDLVHWRLLTRPLTRASQLNMLGDPDSCGIWAPCLTHADGLFYLIYTDVKRYGRTTPAGSSRRLVARHAQLSGDQSDKLDGEWSDPIYLNSSGFDPSLFHDDDGRKYLVNMLWDHRPGHNRFAGIVAAGIFREGAQVGRRRHLIFKGTSIGFTEGPHLYKRDGYYYLLTAEGGTGWGHAVTLARSRNLFGPYELHPDTYILTRARSAGRRTAALRACRSGRDAAGRNLHGSPLRPAAAQSRTLHAGSRNGDPEDGWSRRRLAAHRGWAGHSACRGRRPGFAAHAFPPAPAREDFDAPQLPLDFQWLRSPWPEELFSLTARPGFLRLYGRETHGQPVPPVAGGAAAAGALRQRGDRAWSLSRKFPADGRPDLLLQRAKFHYLYVSHDEEWESIFA